MKIKLKAFVIVGIMGVVFYGLFKDTFYQYKMMNYYKITREHFEEIDKKDKVTLNSTGAVLKNIAVYDNENKKRLLNQLLNRKGKIIVNFSNSKCSSCIEDVLYFINKYKKEINLENVILLGNFQDQRDYIMFKHENKINLKMYNIYNQKLELEVETLNYPYIVITDSVLKAKSTFIPAKELPKRTDDYFKMIKNKL